MDLITGAKEIVREYVEAHIDKDNPDVSYTLFVVWQTATLQHFKCEIATTLPYGMSFVLTYDGDEGKWYCDAYRKVENWVMP